MKRITPLTILTVSLAALISFLGMTGAASALDAAIGPHPGLQNEKQVSRHLYHDKGGARRVIPGKDVAVAKLNGILFRETMLRLTAPNAFQMKQPILPERPNPHRIAQ